MPRGRPRRGRARRGTGRTCAGSVGSLGERRIDPAGHRPAWAPLRVILAFDFFHPPSIVNTSRTRNSPLLTRLSLLSVMNTGSLSASFPKSSTSPSFCWTVQVRYCFFSLNAVSFPVERPMLRDAPDTSLASALRASARLGSHPGEPSPSNGHRPTGERTKRATRTPGS